MKTDKTQLVTLTINGKTMFGYLDDNTFTGIQIGPGPIAANFPTYIKQREMGQLKKMIIGDKNTMVLEPLTDEDQLEMDRLESLFDIAKKRSGAWVNVKVFETMLGK